MQQYHDALKHILDNGQTVSNRTGIDTVSVFGYQMRFDLAKGFPAVTTKQLAWRAVVGELLWFLEGSTDERRLAEITYEQPRAHLAERTTIWTANADAQGRALGYVNNKYVKELGPVYGHQWRQFDGANLNKDSFDYNQGTDQIAWIIHEIQTNPDSRRLILSAWNPQQLSEMALPPCHALAQFRVIDNRLSCQLYQRSADFGLGVPFNIASYSLLTHMLAQITNLEVGEFIWTGGDCHIYNNHVEAITKQLTLEPKKLPTLIMPSFTNLDELLNTKTSEYMLDGYEPYPTIKMDMAV